VGQVVGEVSGQSAEERPKVAINIATLAATAMIAEQVAGKVTRDTLFLSHFPATELPRAMVAAAVLSILAALAFSELLARSTPARIVPRIFGASAALFVGEWFLAGTAPQLVAVSLFLHMSAFGLLVISGFWSLINETFDPHTAKRAVGRIGAGAALGGVVGGLLADRVVAYFGLRSMLLALAILHTVSALGVARVGRHHQATGAPLDGDSPQALSVILEHRYLQQIAWLVALAALIAAPLDYALKSEAAASYKDSAALASFFAAFYTTAGILGFLVQRILAVPTLRRFGLGGTLAVLPGMIFLTSLVGSIMPRLGTILAARGSEALLANSLFRSGVELLYTPVAPAAKRPSKAVIDVAAQRFGDLTGAGLVLLILLLIPEESVRASVALGGAFSLVTLVVVRRLHRGYVRQLAESLRRGAVTLDSQDVLDATTARTVSRTRTAIDRWTIRRGAGASRSREPRVALRSVPSSLGRGTPAPQGADRVLTPADLLRAMEALLSGDGVQARPVLEATELDLRLVRSVIPWLGDAELGESARTALVRVAPRILGQLQDALLDPSTAALVRAAIPPVLEAVSDKRAIDALVLGLEDESFDVRFACGQTLARLGSSAPTWRPPPERLLALAQRDFQERAGSSFAVDELRRPDGRRAIEHVFNLTAAALGPETVRFAISALASQDSHLRGTALEYLENVLPGALRETLLAQVSAGGSGSRSAKDLAERLERNLQPVPRGGRSK
jgi:hypothetical protein